MDHSMNIVRITLIHALNLSLLPAQQAFARLWPAAKLRNILDDSLSSDLALSGGLDQRTTDRFLTLGRYALASGTDAILFTCSAFGPCVEAVRSDLYPLPVRGPSQGMIAAAAALGGRIGLVATFEPTLATLPAEFPAGVEIVPIFAAGALEALARGDGAEHDRLIGLAAADANVDAIAIAQFSAARAARAVHELTGKTVLTAPESAVRGLAHIFPS
jgi:hypothetical protein